MKKNGELKVHATIVNDVSRYGEHPHEDDAEQALGGTPCQSPTTERACNGHGQQPSMPATGNEEGPSLSSSTTTSTA